MLRRQRCHRVSKVHGYTASLSTARVRGHRIGAPIQNRRHGLKEESAGFQEVLPLEGAGLAGGLVNAPLGRGALGWHIKCFRDDVHLPRKFR